MRNVAMWPLPRLGCAFPCSAMGYKLRRESETRSDDILLTGGPHESRLDYDVIGT